MIDRGNIATVIFVAVALPTCVLGNVFFYRIVAKVNSRLPRAERISVFWLGLGKMSKIRELHKRFFPGSRLLLCFDAMRVVFLASFGLALYRHQNISSRINA